MEMAVQLSSRMYRWLSYLYPRELRGRFGVSMVEVFEDQLAEERQRRGISGIVSVWSTALWEVASVGMLARLNSTEMIAGTLSLLVSSLIAWIFFRTVG